MTKAKFLMRRKCNNAPIQVLIAFFLMGCGAQESQFYDLNTKKGKDSCKVFIREFEVKHSSQMRYMHSWAYDFEAMDGKLYRVGMDTSYISIDVPAGTESKINMPTLLFQKLRADEPMIKIYPSVKDSTVVFFTQKAIYTWYMQKTDSFDVFPVGYWYNNGRRFSINPYQGSGFQAMKRGDFIGFPVLELKPQKRESYSDGCIRGYEIEVDLKYRKTNYRYLDFPDLLNEYNYGFLSETHRIKVGDTNIVSFQFTGDIYIEYNNNNTSVVGGKSEFQKSPFIRPMELRNKKRKVSEDSFWYYYTHNDYYTEMIYNPIVGCFARFYIKPLGSRKPNSELYFTAEDKVYILQVFNRNLELIYEKPVEGLNFVYYLIPYKSGFITNWNGLKSNSDKHIFKYYEIR